MKSYTSKQRRQASHIEEGAKRSGKSGKRAKQIAYATVNKQDGGEKSGAGRGKKRNTSAARKGGRIGGRAKKK